MYVSSKLKSASNDLAFVDLVCRFITFFISSTRAIIQRSDFTGKHRSGNTRTSSNNCNDSYAEIVQHQAKVTLK